MKKILKLLTSKLLLAVLFFLMQIAAIVFIIMGLMRRYENAAIWLQAGLTAISILVSVYIINRDENAGFKLAWIFSIMLFPLFGGLLFLFVGRQTTRKKMRKKMTEINAATDQAFEEINNIPEFAAADPTNIKVSNYVFNNSKFPVYKNTMTEYFSSGEKMFESLKEELKKAKKFIFLEFFIIERGIFWDSILEILRERAANGVDVKLIYDDIGCAGKIPSNYYKKLQEMGIQTKVFNKIKASINANNRDHRKIVVIDGEISYTSGINLADEYINVKELYGHWKETGMKFTGAATWSFSVMFLRFWVLSGGEIKDFEKTLPRSYNEEKAVMQKFIDSNPAVSDGYVQPLSGGPDKACPLHKNTFLQIINNATKYVYISTPYLILDDETVLALCLCAKSGIDVRIIMPHIPDKKIIFSMSRSFYPKLIKNGVKIYEYLPGFNHAKSIISDDHTGYIGSCNFDYRSFYLHFECGALLYDTSSIIDMKNDYFTTLNECKLVSFEEAAKVNIFMKLWRSFLRLFAPLC